MKYLPIIAAFAAVMMFTACGKKDAQGPVPHHIKITATGSAAFTATASVIKNGLTNSTTLDTREVTIGSYDYSTTLNSGDQVHFEMMTNTENTISYTVTDNGVTVAQETAKELGSHTKAYADFTIN